MKYLGGKTLLKKHIHPIILAEANKRCITTWIEPFVGGANSIDTVPSYFTRVGLDINPHTIHALIGIRDYIGAMPEKVSEEFYSQIRGTPPNPITSFIRFVMAFGGKFESGFARGWVYKQGYSIERCHWVEATNSAKRQSILLQDIDFICTTYNAYEYPSYSCVIYCDPPYAGTTSYKTEYFDHTQFWDWCRMMTLKGHLVYISEYNAPSDFQCVWSKEHFTTLNSGRKNKTTVIEKLFTYALP